MCISFSLFRYVLSMGDARDLEDYMNELLDASNPQTKVFIKELLVKWREAKCRGSKKAEVL